MEVLPLLEVNNFIDALDAFEILINIPETVVPDHCYLITFTREDWVEFNLGWFEDLLEHSEAFRVPVTWRDLMLTLIEGAEE
jgi:hypothetical protein